MSDPWNEIDAALIAIGDKLRAAPRKPLEPLRKTSSRPVDGRWVVPVNLNSELDAAIAETRRQDAEIRASTMRPLEHAAEVIMARGYHPADCLLETHDVGGPFDTRILIKVCGEPVFEVTRTSDGDLAKDLKINLTITARWLSMPPLRDVRTEPIQSRRHLDGSGGGPAA